MFSLLALSSEVGDMERAHWVPGRLRISGGDSSEAEGAGGSGDGKGSKDEVEDISKGR